MEIDHEGGKIVRLYQSYWFWNFFRSDSDVDDNIDDDAQPLTLEEIRESLLQIEDDSKKHEPVKSPEVPSEVSERDEEIAPLY